MTDQPTNYLQSCLDRLHDGDEQARKELLNSTCERLAQLTHIMLKDYPRLKRWEQTGDVLQNAMLRLYRTLQTVTPESLRDYFRLATLQIRRELLDLVRHYYGPEGAGGKHATNATSAVSEASRTPLNEPADVSLDPRQLAVWTEFHQQVQALPEEEREVFDLVWYQALAHTEAALVLNVSARTVKRRWQAACLTLHEALKGQLPGLSS
jgi:RNA polymerase sigma factor (sigma-70 family)